MPTCRDIITLGLRLAGVLGLNAQPTASEATNGLSVLQGLYETWFFGGMFGRLADVLKHVDYEAAEGERVRATDGATITLPTEITSDGTPRAPRDLAAIEVFNEAGGTHLLNIFDRNAWVNLKALALTDEAPLAMRGRDGLAACFAEAYAEAFGSSIGPGVGRRAGAFRRALIGKASSTRDDRADEYF